MSNFLLRDPDCVLIHIPKTGGTSIRKGVWQKNYDGPTFGHLPDDWRGYFKFAFVRHPFERLISAWKMFTVGTVGDPDWSMATDARPLDMKEFVDIVLDETIIYDERRFTFEERIRHHTLPQTHSFNCLHYADFVGRYENLERDFAIILDRLNFKATLPHMHRTTHGGWRDYLDGKTLRLCREFYSQDFVQLGYAE